MHVSQPGTVLLLLFTLSDRDEEMCALEQFLSGEIAHERSPPGILFGVS